MLTSLKSGEREWTVSRPADVAAALADARLSVARPPSEAGAAEALLARMARFSDGDAHQRRRALVTSLLPPVPGVAAAARMLTEEALASRTSAFDLMPLARSLPAAALAIALGLPAASARRAARLTGQLCDVVAAGAPDSGDAGARSADEAASELDELLASLRGREASPAMAASPLEWTAAMASVLFQARDATAALIGLTMLASQPPASPAGPAADKRKLVDRVLRHGAPVRATRRSVVTATELGGAVVPAGATVRVMLAAAETGGPVPATFGDGPHSCPGSGHAAAIAAEVVTVLTAAGWYPVGGQPCEFEPRRNLRMPRRVLVGRA